MLDRLSGFSTNTFRLETQGSDQSTANKILRFTLPSNSLINLRSFALHFNATANGTASAGGRLPAKIETLVERVEVSVGGIQLSAGSNFYNVLTHARQALMGDKSDPILGHPDVVRQVSYVDNSTITTTNNETYASTNKSCQFCIDHWEGFLGTCEPKLFDSALVPDIVISIYLADNNVLTSSAGVTLSGAGAALGHRQPHDLCLCDVGAVQELAGDPAVVHDEDSVGHAEHLGQFGADHHDRLAAGRQIVHEQVDLVSCADVDAAGRLVEK
jgi:hypothetical protein